MKHNLARMVLAGAALLLSTLAARAQPDRVETLEHQGLTRNFELRLPGGQDAGPRPLVIALHGLSDVEDWRRPVRWLRGSWTMDAVADREGFVVAYPAAVNGRWSYTAQRPVTLPGRTELVDDMGFLRALIDRLAAKRIVDPRRVFAAGASRGGLMAWAMACGMSERIIAAAPLITGMTDGQLGPCRPARPVPLLAIAGTNDRPQPYDGWLYPDYRLLSVPETMDFWRRLHGCSGQTGRELPHREQSDPTRAVLVEWTGCRTGGPLRLYRIQGGGHQLPTFAPDTSPPSQWAGLRNHDIEAAEEIWRFFAASMPARSTTP